MTCSEKQSRGHYSAAAKEVAQTIIFAKIYIIFKVL